MVRMVTVVYVVDGAKIQSLEDFWRVMGEAVNGPDGYFGRNLDAFADCLRGGFGTPDDDDFVVQWRDHELSRRSLGFSETVRQLELRLARCHPANRPSVRTVNPLKAWRRSYATSALSWAVDAFLASVI